MSCSLTAPHPAAGLALDLPGDCERAAQEVDVADLERGGLAEPQPGEGGSWPGARVVGAVLVPRRPDAAPGPGHLGTLHGRLPGAGVGAVWRDPPHEPRTAPP
jgi:hypothetical protein